MSNCIFGRHHQFSVWYEQARLVVNSETLHCMYCPTVQLEDGKLVHERDARLAPAQPRQADGERGE